jgi:hypothetical protein
MHWNPLQYIREYLTSPYLGLGPVQKQGVQSINMSSHENQLHISRDKGTIYQAEPCWNGSDDTIKYEANNERHQLLLSRQLAYSCSCLPPLPVTR